MPRVRATFLFALLTLLAAGCGDAAQAELGDAAFSAADAPGDWSPAPFGQAEAQPLWEVLPELLVSNADAGLFIRAFTGPDGREGVSTILIETDDPKAVPRLREGDRALAPLARLLDEQDALLAPPMLGGDPGAYFAASDDPLPGALRSRLVRLLDEDERLYSDSLVFTNGPVLAVVTVWYPEDEGPVQDVEELAAGVQERVQDYLDQG